MHYSLEKPHIQLVAMSRWYVVSRALHAVARLGVANHMSLEPTSVDELAQATRTRPELLDRILRFLSAYDLFKHHNGAYALTPLSQALRDDDPYSMRDVLCMVDESWWQAFSQLELSLQSGVPAFEEQHGENFFNFLRQHPDKQHNFDKGMAQLSTYDVDAISKAYRFSTFATLVDMGGGHGSLSQALSREHPGLSIILFDETEVIAQLDPDCFAQNVALQEGTLLGKLPQADAYLFKKVLHEFNEQKMQQVLMNCAQQMPENATLLVAEQVMSSEPQQHPNNTMDIVMMVLLGGRQRTLPEWRQAVESAGFSFQNSYETNSLFTLMEFKLG